MYRDFVAFCLAAQVDISQVTPLLLLAFLELMAKSGLSEANIANHLSAIRALQIMHGLNTSAFQDQRLQLFIKSLRITLVPVIAR